MAGDVINGDAGVSIWRKAGLQYALIAAAGLANVAVFALDVYRPVNLVFSLFYMVPICIVTFALRRGWLWTIGLAAFVLSIISTFAASPRTAALPTLVFGLQLFVLNRMLISCALLPLILVGSAAQRFYWRTRSQAEQLSNSFNEVMNANREIGLREQEILRQNEELQAQTEELERQGEELRLTNEELGRRERTLEQLLDLSRSLTAETSSLSFDEIFNRLCITLMELSQSDGAAILVRDGDLVRITAHCGFGLAGVERESIPLNASFANLIMTRQQTGYIESIEERNDLEIPQPMDGRRFVSMLAAPLVIRGRTAGVVELYSTTRKTWSAEQISLLESLAAQATVSMNSAEMFDNVQRERLKFETVFRTMPLPMIVAEDKQLGQLRFNPAATQFFGVTGEGGNNPFVPAAARQSGTLYLDGRPVPDRDLPMRRAMQGDSVQQEEYDVIFSPGSRKSVLVSSAPIVDQDGAAAGVVLTCVDITPIKKLQQELDSRRREAEESSIRKTRFLAAISHDIRTPVNAINLMAELIRRGSNSPGMIGELPNMAQELQSNANALSTLVHDLLDVARFDSGKVEFQESDFALGSLLADECRQLLPLAQEKGLTLDYETQGSTLWIRADRVKISRIMSNLVGNAIKFTRSGGIVIRSGINAEGQAYFQVSDTGVGISREHLSRIFEEFTQLHNPERDRFKGTGLGLAISKRLVEAMGGTIGVQSIEGRGSTFTVTLPKSIVVASSDADRAARRIVPDLPDPTLTGLRVLLVEDHVSTRWATSQILLAEGAIVLEAADGTRAMGMLYQADADVILLDMMLPDMDGLRILEAIRDKRPTRLRKIFVLTGDATTERVSQVTQLGADGIVSKPIDVDGLIKLLRTVMQPTV
jgi:signal transduction histidine kinase